MRKLLIMILTVGVLAPATLKSQVIQVTSIHPVFSSQRVDKLTYTGKAKGWIPRIAGRQFSYGLNTYANSEVVYVLNGKYDRFEAWTGIENGNVKNTSAELDNQVEGKVKAKNGKVVFEVYADGVRIYQGPVMDIQSAAQKISVSVRNVMELQLIVRDRATGGNPNHSSNTAKINWAEPVLVLAKTKAKTTGGVPAVYTVRSGNQTSLKLDAKGNIVSMTDGSSSISAQGSTLLGDAQELKFLGAKKLPGGAVQFSRLLVNTAGKRCILTETFAPTPTSIRWTADVEGEGGPWGSAIITSFKTAPVKETRFWTSWSHPDLIGQGYWNNDTLKTQWADPLQTRPFTNSSRWYGGNPMRHLPTSGDLFSIPIASVLNPKTGRGFTLVQSPEDSIIYMKLITSANGEIRFQRTCNRIEKGKHVRFSMDLIAHEADWRAGLNWMTLRYANYFDTPTRLAHDVGGCGAYSSWEGELDAPKLKNMAFKFNWKASFDFPYMGMFLPPEANWQTFATSAEAKKDPWVRTPYKGAPTSRTQLENYSALMRSYDFHVLNYFNVTEFGTAIKKPTGQLSAAPGPDDWKDCNVYLQKYLADGILYDEDGSDNYYYTWGNAIVMDPGAEQYQKFMLEQAQRHIDYLPSSSGICIDRMDWLRYFNTRADDGISWYNDKPARSLYTSWNSLMDKLGPLMHRSNKVVFLNPMSAMRLDAMKHGDGIYSEHNELGPGLNSSVFLGVRKPVVAWTWDEKSLKPDPDFYLQRFLYLGVFPSAPVPDNNHEISPGEFTDHYYLKYGGLFNALMKRTWSLTANVVNVQGNHAKANVFDVPDGLVMPVVMAENGLRTITATVRIQHPERYRVDALLPGRTEPVAVTAKPGEHSITVTFPVEDKCAVVRFIKIKADK